jgi:hypothetical protein
MGTHRGIEIHGDQIVCCGDPMEFQCSWSDDDQFAFNIYICNRCGNILKDDLLLNDGFTVMDKRGGIGRVERCHYPKVFFMVKKPQIED